MYLIFLFFTFANKTTNTRSMKFNVNIFQDEDGYFIAECPSIPGCVSQGKTKQAAENNIKEAITECLKVRAEKNMPLTVPVSNFN